MKDLGITKGDWKYEVKFGKNRPRITVQIPIRQGYSKEIILGTISEDDCTVSSCCCTEEHSNAKLIADAGTTANKCGLLPSELLDQREEMLEFLKTIESSENTPIHHRSYAKRLIQKITE